jgi:hypothetical protein
MDNSGEKAALETKIKNIGHQIALLEALKAQCIRKLQVLSVPAVSVNIPLRAITSDERIATVLR